MLIKFSTRLRQAHQSHTSQRVFCKFCAYMLYEFGPWLFDSSPYSGKHTFIVLSYFLCLGSSMKLGPGLEPALVLSDITVQIHCDLDSNLHFADWANNLVCLFVCFIYIVACHGRDVKSTGFKLWCLISRVWV